MKDHTEILSRMEQIRCDLLIVERRLQEELDQYLTQKDDRLLRFLHQEKCVWEFALAQFEWVLAE